MAEWSSAVQLYLDSCQSQITKRNMRSLEWEIFGRMLRAMVPDDEKSDGMMVIMMAGIRQERMDLIRADLSAAVFLDDEQDMDPEEVRLLFYRLRALARATIPEVAHFMSIVTAQRMVSERPEAVQTDVSQVAHTPVMPNVEMDPQAIASGFPTMQAPYDVEALENLRNPNFSLEHMTRDRLLIPVQGMGPAPVVHKSLRPAIPPPPSPPPDVGDSSPPLDMDVPFDSVAPLESSEEVADSPALEIGNEELSDEDELELALAEFLGPEKNDGQCRHFSRLGLLPGLLFCPTPQIF